MKIISLVFLFILLSCNSGEKNPRKELQISSEVIENPFIVVDIIKLKGMYIGDFGGSDIRLVLNYLSPNHAVGYNIHKGLQRNISGKVKESAEEIILELNEPGDNQFDGVFILTFSKRDLSKPTGTWIANSTKIGKKNFQLEKIENHQLEVDLSELKLSDINKYNFPSLFGHCTDSIADIYFDEDGLVRYEYYPEIDLKERKEQLKIIKGTWTFKGDKINVSWQENTVFEDKTTIIKLNIAPDFEFSLKSKNRTLYPNYYDY